MSLHQWLGVGVIGLLAAFIWFTFRQGLKVKPDDPGDHASTPGSDGRGGHWGDGW
jgi:hypothetical protein